MASEFLFYTKRMNSFYTWAFQESARELELSQVEIDILLFLHHNPAYNTARDIGQTRGIAKSNVSTGIRLLELKGMLDVCIDPENRKIHRLTLTEKSRDVVERLAGIQKRIFEVMLDGISQEEKDAVSCFFQKSDANMKRVMESGTAFPVK